MSGVCSKSFEIHCKQAIFCSKMKKFSTYGFSGINVKKDIADRFRAFSKEVSRSHSETLEAMLNFFKWNDIDSNDNLNFRNYESIYRISFVIVLFISESVNPNFSALDLQQKSGQLVKSHAATF